MTAEHTTASRTGATTGRSECPERGTGEGVPASCAPPGPEAKALGIIRDLTRLMFASLSPEKAAGEISAATEDSQGDQSRSAG